MKKILCAALLAAFFCAAYAENEVVKIWDGVKMPGTATDKPEKALSPEVCTNVSVPRLTLFLVKGDKPAAAVLVCPGGGYTNVCFGYEGDEIAKWLNSIGVSAAVLKYRTPANREGAFADAQRALRLMRFNAAKWNIDPARIGMLGFSAGGHLTAQTSTGYDIQAYAPQDAADKLSARPDFSVLVYPAYLYADANYTLSPEIKVDKNTPPAFITQAQDDVKYFDSSIAYYLALKKAGVKADLHLFADGGHGHGIRRNKEPMKDWEELCGQWILYYFGAPKAAK